MTRAGHGISVNAINVRSTSLDRDLNAAPLERLLLTGRGADLLQRFTHSVSRPDRGRSWSVTGPYGSGKSSFALLLASLVSPDVAVRSRALAVVANTDPVLARAFGSTLDEHAPQGMFRAAAAARREPVTRTVARALGIAANEAASLVGSRRVKGVRDALALAATADGDDASSAILQAVDALSDVAPVLLVIDEFGKNLEYHASAAAEPSGDLYLLQELSEAATTERGKPLYLVTLQHLGFLDYAGNADALQRREWSKIQGRFEEILFVESAPESAKLLARTIRQPSPRPAALKRYGVDAATAWEEAGLSRVLPADPALLAGVYPLHPMVLVAAPLLFGSLAQNDRTLTGFLAGDEPHTLAEYLKAHDHGQSGDPSSLPTLKLPALFDYLAAGARTSLMASSSAARWLEIETRIAEARGLTTDQQDLLKSVAVLNLIDAGGALRASTENLALALTEPTDWNDASGRKRVMAFLRSSMGKRFLTYRQFSDEWRLWQGSDIDLAGRVDLARSALLDVAPAQIVPAAMLPTAIVAGRHAQHVGMLRYFDVVVTDATTDAIDVPANRDAADGLMVFHLGTDADVPIVRGAKPALVGVTPDAKLVIDAALEARACQDVLNSGDLDVPSVAELRERLAQARSRLAAHLAEAYRPQRPDVHWTFDGDTLHDHRSLSALVSTVCDRAYSRSPRIRNEMLGRHQLTSQGAKARRVLIGTCIAHPDEQALGMEHYGPERAMYEGVLNFLGLHRRRRDGAYEFAAPAAGSSAQKVWTALTAEMCRADKPIGVDRLYENVMAPPYGLKAGVVPLLLLTALLVHRDDVALFEDGTYQPNVSPALMERLVKTPERFAVTATGTSAGARAKLVSRLAVALELPTTTRAQTTPLLRVVNALLSTMRELDGYSRKTARVSRSAKAIREALFTARDPGELLFTALPQAVGRPPVGATTEVSRGSDALVADIVSAVRELQDARFALREEVIATLCAAFRTPPSLPALRRALRARADVLSGMQLEPGLAGLVAHALNDLDDEEWLDPLVLIITGRPLDMWTDDQVARLRPQAAALAASLEDARILQAHAASDARLLSLTGVDGNRHELLLGARPDEDLMPVLEAALQRARKRHGAAAEMELLNLLLQRVVTESGVTA